MGWGVEITQQMCYDSSRATRAQRHQGRLDALAAASAMAERVLDRVGVAAGARWLGLLRDGRVPGAQPKR